MSVTSKPVPPSTPPPSPPPGGPTHPTPTGPPRRSDAWLEELLDASLARPRQAPRLFQTLGGAGTLLACVSELQAELDGVVPGHAHDAEDLFRFRVNLARQALRELIAACKLPARQDPQAQAACPEGSPGGPGQFDGGEGGNFTLPLRPAFPRFTTDPIPPMPGSPPGPPPQPDPRPQGIGNGRPLYDVLPAASGKPKPTPWPRPPHPQPQGGQL